MRYKSLSFKLRCLIVRAAHPGEHGLLGVVRAVVVHAIPAVQGLQYVSSSAFISGEKVPEGQGWGLVVPSSQK